LDLCGWPENLRCRKAAILMGTACEYLSKHQASRAERTTKATAMIASLRPVGYARAFGRAVCALRRGVFGTAEAVPFPSLTREEGIVARGREPTIPPTSKLLGHHPSDDETIAKMGHPMWCWLGVGHPPNQISAARYGHSAPKD
jgi:hypothetical protein